MEDDELQDIISDLKGFFDVDDANERLDKAKDLVDSLERVAKAGGILDVVVGRVFDRGNFCGA